MSSTLRGKRGKLKYGLSGWLGRERVGAVWHWMYDGGSEAACGARGPFSAGPQMSDTFRSPERVKKADRCVQCEAMLP